MEGCLADPALPIIPAESLNMWVHAPSWTYGPVGSSDDWLPPPSIWLQLRKKARVRTVQLIAGSLHD